jgi:hypothetical protein
VRETTIVASFREDSGGSRCESGKNGLFELLETAAYAGIEYGVANLRNGTRDEIGVHRSREQHLLFGGLLKLG